MINGMSSPTWVPAGIDTEKPSIARMYDYLLGGSHNFAVDRVAVDKITTAMPTLPAILRANRSFLRRAVRFFVDQGVTQFLDLGSGVPTVGNVHEVAQAIAPQARIVYVDIDPVAVAHSQAILAGNPNAASSTPTCASLTRSSTIPGSPCWTWTARSRYWPWPSCTSSATRTSRPRSSGSTGTGCRPAATWRSRTPAWRATRRSRRRAGTSSTASRRVPSW